MTEYNDYKYEKLQDGRWLVIFPSGARLKAPPQTEDELKAAIDSYEAGQ